MSASNEVLLEQIETLKKKILQESQEGKDVSELEKQLSELHERWNRSVQDLNENKQVLKG